MNKYKLTIHPDMDDNRGVHFVEYFDNINEMQAFSDGAARVLLFVQDELQIMPDRSNMFLGEVLVDGVYEEIE